MGVLNADLSPDYVDHMKNIAPHDKEPAGANELRRRNMQATRDRVGKTYQEALRMEQALEAKTHAEDKKRLST
ncbi:hypothetical protein [Photobacterium lutimaris]|uniref:Uncharacterized protein n=1 Tax=Photobacterium lutimaris TaxID=388278 RepID=A0A2T3J4N3_9GAMM|nr:hypothetical protein [Photobacterium lutimaris]PSU36213.1 hypothetical protein C9I99_04220 [Photobacterium lutimaris]TDR74915.1 hypothetical protein DFP78_106246 [Photobacterium lutimaris]